VASFYLASGDNPGHDEIDMEFMGNCTGSPVVLSTNGDGRKEQQFGLWFDPAADFHTYAILWNDRNVVFRVDGKVVRVFNRHPDHPYPGGKPMRVHATIWDGSWWATRHGTVPVDWSHAPFVVSYRDYSAVGCTPMGEGKPLACPAGTDRWMKRRRPGHPRVGQGQAHELRLLQGRVEVSQGIPRRVLPQPQPLIQSISPHGFLFFSFRFSWINIWTLVTED
jgi:hypothetical protein